MPGPTYTEDVDEYLRYAMDSFDVWGEKMPTAPITATCYVNFGGVLMDEHARALTSGGRPVKNLYTPSPCGGGVFCAQAGGRNDAGACGGVVCGPGPSRTPPPLGGEPLA